MRISILLVSLFLIVPVALSAQQLMINEAASTGKADFVELYNASDAPFVFAGVWQLLDEREGALDGDKPFTIPEGTTIPARGYLALYPYKVSLGSGKDVPKGVPEGAMSAVSFALGSKDRVTLLHDAQVVDSVFWDSDILSYGRLPDGSEKFDRLLIATPGAANEREPISSDLFPIVINEVNSNGLDYVELYNTSDEPFLFHEGSWTLEDAAKGDSFLIPKGTVLPAKGFLVIYPDLLRLPLSAAGLGLTFASSEGDRFGLGSSDSVYLRYRGAIVDHLTWSVHVTSAGRVPDGADRWVMDIFMSPGRSNGSK